MTDTDSLSSTGLRRAGGPVLTPEQVARYHEVGYAVVEGVFTRAETRELQEVTDHFVRLSANDSYDDQVMRYAGHKGFGASLFDLEPEHTADRPLPRRLNSPVTSHPCYERALRNPVMLDIAEQLLGPSGVRLHAEKLNMKLGGVGSPVQFHQDWAYYPYTNDDGLAIGIAIDDIDAGNGAMQVLPGSHKGPIFDHHYDGHFCGAITDPAFNPTGAVPLEVKAGGITIHHVRTVHGSATNTSDRPRRFLLFALEAADAWPLRGVTDIDAWNAKLLRGQPTLHPRVEACPVRIPLPGIVKGGSIYENQSILPTPLFVKHSKTTKTAPRL